MNDTRYFIFNHAERFLDCSLDGVAWHNNCIGIETEGTVDSAVTGRLTTPVLDSMEKGNVWQRVLADVSIPEGSKIIWRMTAYDSEATRLMSVAAVYENATDFIPIGVHGRFAILNAEIYGNVEIRTICIYSAWESFLNYLPEIYRDYNSFTDRFLRLFTTAYLEVEQKIEEMPRMFDPAVASYEELRRLAKIVGVPHINLWEPEGLRRLLLSGVYKRRGQFSVFADYIEYFTGYRPYIAEHFRYLTGQVENDRLYSDGDVTIFLPPEASHSDLNMDMLDLIIADFLPEDLVWRVLQLNSNPTVSGYAYLGINMQIGDYSETVVGKSRIGTSIITAAGVHDSV